MRTSTFLWVSLLAISTFALQGCGRKGPLFMEAPQSAPATQIQIQSMPPRAIPTQSQPEPTTTLQNQSEPTK